MPAPNISDRNLILGVDPGFNGALALYNLDTKSLVQVMDMPLKIWKGTDGKTRKHVNGTELAFFLDLNRDLIRGCVIEEVSAGPNDGKVSAFRFGMNTGVLHGAIAAHLIPIMTVRPGVWKMNLGLSSDKKLSLQKAKVLFPEFQSKFLRAKDDGRAEAALLAKYGERIFLPLPKEKALI